MRHEQTGQYICDEANRYPKLCTAKEQQRQVVGAYFKIEDTTRKGKRKFLDLDGNRLSN